MERLTRYDKDGRVQIKVFNGSIGGSYEYPLINSSVTRRAIDRLAELEDKLESGELLELPTIISFPDTLPFMGKTIIYQVVWLSDLLGVRHANYATKEAAEARLRELQEQKK